MKLNTAAILGTATVFALAAVTNAQNVKSQRKTRIFDYMKEERKQQTARLGKDDEDYWMRLLQQSKGGSSKSSKSSPSPPPPSPGERSKGKGGSSNTAETNTEVGFLNLTDDVAGKVVEPGDTCVLAH